MEIPMRELEFDPSRRQPVPVTELFKKKHLHRHDHYARRPGPDASQMHPAWHGGQDRIQTDSIETDRTQKDRNQTERIQTDRIQTDDRQDLDRSDPDRPDPDRSDPGRPDPDRPDPDPNSIC